MDIAAPEPVPSRPPLRVGMIGYSFMGAAHAQAWHTASRFFDLPFAPELRAVAGRDEQAVSAAAARFSAADHETDALRLIEREDIDLVDICSPGDTHHELALAALAAGKHVLCEKPLASTVAQAEEMTAAAARAAEHGVRSLCGFNYRRVPALALARELVAQGRLGRIRQIRAQYLQDWLSDVEAPITWRLQKDRAGAGALGDIGSHAIDLAQWLSGQQVTAVSGTVDTFVATRPVRAGSAERAEVSVDDAALFTARFDGGTLGSFEATRYATGRRNALRIELSGSEGALAFDFERMNELEFYDATDPAGRQGFRRIQATEPKHPYADHWWLAGHGLGYEHTFTHEIADLVTAIGEQQDPSPSFAEALHVQRVMAAVQDSAADESRWHDVGIRA